MTIPGPDDDPDLLAAEYALGVLDDAEARALEARSFTDPALATSIAAWEHRLAPLAGVVVPVAPPAVLWQRLALATGIESVIQPGRPATPRPNRAPNQAPNRAPNRAWRSAGLWRATTAGAMAIAASLAFLIYTAPPAPYPLIAALTPYGAAGATFLVRVDADGVATVATLGNAAVPQGRALELWAVRGTAAPVSLGLLPGAGRGTLTIHQPEDTQLLVSQEPAGGSPTKAPTGPVVYAGKLTGI